MKTIPLLHSVNYLFAYLFVCKFPEISPGCLFLITIRIKRGLFSAYVHNKNPIKLPSSEVFYGAYSPYSEPKASHMQI